jgi:hypothetical protein
LFVRRAERRNTLAGGGTAVEGTQSGSEDDDCEGNEHEGAEGAEDAGGEGKDDENDERGVSHGGCGGNGIVGRLLPPRAKKNLSTQRLMASRSPPGSQNDWTTAATARRK